MTVTHPSTAILYDAVPQKKTLCTTLEAVTSSSREGSERERGSEKLASTETWLPGLDVCALPSLSSVLFFRGRHSAVFQSFIDSAVHVLSFELLSPRQFPV